MRVKTQSMVTDLKPYLLSAALAFGLAFASSDAQAREMPMNASELIKKVEDANVGWDWIPRCGDGAHWDVDDEYCKGGSGSGRDGSSESYGLSNAKELIAKVEELNVGWDWEPRCADGAYWSWRDNYCKGGSGE